MKQREAVVVLPADQYAKMQQVINAVGKGYVVTDVNTRLIIPLGDPLEIWKLAFGLVTEENDG